PRPRRPPSCPQSRGGCARLGRFAQECGCGLAPGSDPLSRGLRVRKTVAELRLSEDGMYYWDGRQWVTTLSPDGRFRWNGSAWVPVGGMAPPAPYHQPPATPRVPTPWTKPMQYAVAAWYGVSGLFALSVPLWLSGPITD